jgi:putative hydrolase of the HAD superfamily
MTSVISDMGTCHECLGGGAIRLDDPEGLESVSPGTEAWGLYNTKAAPKLGNAMLNIRAIAFDLDNTLWDVDPVIDRAELLMLEWLREHCPRIPERHSVEEMRAAREQLAREEPHNAHDFTYLRTAVLERLARECGYEACIAARAFDVFFAARNDVELFEDVKPALIKLGERYRLATLSNGNADLERIGLAPFFAVCLNARQIGVGKPHPRCFERLARELQLEPWEVLYVGDDPLKDVAAARAAGLFTAWMNRWSTPWPDEVAAPDLTITDCSALVTKLL